MPSASVIGMVDKGLVPTEWLMVAVFIAGVVTWGFLMRKGAASLEGSFLAGRKVPGLIASLSTVATNLNANDFIGGAGITYAVGVVMSHGKWVNGIALILVSIFVVQKLRRLRVYTLGEWLERRYCRSIGIAYSVTWAFVWMLFNLGLYLYGGAWVLHTLVGWPLYPSIVLLTIVAAFYTLLGGFGAVVATDVLQISLMFFPFVFLAWAVYDDIGGVANLAAVLPADKGTYWAANTEFGVLPIMLFGMFFMGMSYWSSEAQVIQRPLAARSEEDAAVSFLGATFWLSILFPLLVTLPALAAIHYFPDLGNPDLAMPSLIRKFLPRGLYGVTVVGLVAGVLSSADSQINAFCTMFTADIYRRLLRPGRTERHYLAVSKIAGVLFTLAAIGTAYLFSTRQEGMMLFAISVLATIMPPFAAITIMGALMRRMSWVGALVGLISGGWIAIALALASQLGYLDELAKSTLFFRAMVTFLTTAGLTIVVSLLASAQPPDGTDAQPPAPGRPGAPGGSSAEADITYATGLDPVGDMRRPLDLSLGLTPRIVRFVILLVVGMAAMVAFFSYHFR